MILKKKKIGQTVSNRFKATPYLFKFKPFSHLENCQTVANRFAKILEILVAKPSNRHEPPRQSVAKSPRAIACNCEPRHVFPSCQKSDAWNGYGESKYFCITCDIMQSARPSKLNLADTSIAFSKRAKRMAVQASRKSNRSKPFSGLWH